MIHYEDFERERLDPIYDIIAPHSEMGRKHRYFMNGMIRYFKPKKILEVGVSSGGGTALILNAISDIEGAELYSVDYLEKAYMYPDKLSGFLVEESFPNLMDKWHVYRGGDVSRFIGEIGGDIDMLILDTAHIHPWETLNFLCVLPFMKHSESWVMLHDIILHAVNSDPMALACRYLYASVVSEEKFTPEPDEGWEAENGFSNIGAFKVSDLTVKYVDNLFEMLLVPWSSRILDNDVENISRVIEKNYTSEQYKFFCDALKIQDYMIKNPPRFKPLFIHYCMFYEGGSLYKRSSKPYLFLRMIWRLYNKFRNLFKK